MLRSLFGPGPTLTRFESCDDFKELRDLLAKLNAKRDEMRNAIIPGTLGSLAENKYNILNDVINALDENIKKFNLAACKYNPVTELKHMINLVALLTPIIFSAYSDKKTSEILNTFRDEAHENISTALDIGGYVATGVVTYVAPVSILPKFLVFFGGRAVAESVNPKIKENMGIETEYTKSMQILQKTYNTLVQLDINLRKAYERVAPQVQAPSNYQRPYYSAPQ